MRWTPITLTELNKHIATDLADFSDEDRAYFDTVAVDPHKWRQSPYGDEGGGFWVIAVDQDRVLWYNDIEGGFNVSRFTARGTIPDDEYWCNQDRIQWAPPEPLSDE